MHKNRQWANCPQTLQWIPEEQENENQTENNGWVLARDPPKVKLVNKKSLRTL